jgi:hypothetical protein
VRDYTFEPFRLEAGYLVGPQSLYWLQNEQNQVVILFGDFHMFASNLPLNPSKKNVMHLEDFIRHISAQCTTKLLLESESGPCWHYEPRHHGDVLDQAFANNIVQNVETVHCGDLRLKMTNIMGYRPVIEAYFRFVRGLGSNHPVPIKEVTPCELFQHPLFQEFSANQSLFKDWLPEQTQKKNDVTHTVLDQVDHLNPLLDFAVLVPLLQTENRAKLTAGTAVGPTMTPALLTIVYVGDDHCPDLISHLKGFGFVLKYSHSAFRHADTFCEVQNLNPNIPFQVVPIDERLIQLIQRNLLTRFFLSEKTLFLKRQKPSYARSPRRRRAS